MKKYLWATPPLTKKERRLVGQNAKSIRSVCRFRFQSATSADKQARKLPLLLIFIAIWLAICACQTTLITDLAARPGDVLFYDDFSDVSGNWPQFTLPEGTLAYAGGAYTISVASDHYQLWAVSGQVYGDLVVAADATRLSGPAANLFGVICRYQDAGNFYFFVISSDGYFAIGKSKNGHTSLLGQEMMAYSGVIVQEAGKNHLSFSCIGDSLTGAVNGQVVALTRDADFARGDAGLLAGSFEEGGVQVSFDNFLVSAP